MYNMRDESNQSYLVGVSNHPYEKIEVLYSADRETMLQMVDLDAKNIPYCSWARFKLESEASEFAKKLRKCNLSHTAPDLEKQKRRDELFVQLSDEQGLISDFGSVIMNNKFKGNATAVKHIVILSKDHTVFLFSSNETDVLSTYLKATSNISQLRGWKVFSDIDSATKFFEGLESIEKKGSSPSPSLIGSRSKAKVTEAIDGNTAIQSPSFSTPPKLNLFDGYTTMSPPAFNSTKSSVGVSGSEIGSGVSGSSLGMSTPPANVFSGCVKLDGGAYDMSGMKLNFDNGGNERSMGAKIYVSHPIPHKHGAVYYLNVVINVPPSLYFLDARFPKMYIDHLVENHLKRNGHEVPLWMTSLRDLPLCQPGNASEYKRNQKGYVRTTIAFDLEIPKGLGSPDLHVNSAVTTLGSSFKRESECGAQLVSWVKQNKERVYQTETGETGGKKKITHDAFVKTVHNRLVKMFENKTVEYLSPLDKHMTHGHIKDFLVKYCGYEHWNELDRDLKKALFTRWQNHYPDWESTEIKSYRDD
jgi:hypothetical protein